MSNRLHQKNHRFNHHSIPIEDARDPKYPDAGYDPIASFSSPFQGEFYSQGNIITTKNLSAERNVFAKFDIEAKHDCIIGNDLNVSRDVYVSRNVVVDGNFTVLGTTSQIDTVTYVTSAVNIFNAGDGPALRVEQTGFQPIAHFIDNNGLDIVFADNGRLGLGTDVPLADLHLVRYTPNNAEIRVQSTDSAGGALLNLVGTDINTEGCSIAYSNSNGNVTIRNKHNVIDGASFKIETPQKVAIAIANNGNVGIGGVLNPAYPLVVVGDSYVTETVYAKNLSVTNNLHVASVFATNLIAANTVQAATVQATSVFATNLTAANTVQATNIIAENIVVTKPRLVVWDTSIIQATSNLQLPLTANDIELLASSPATITTFSNGTRGALYTITNTSLYVITIMSSSLVFIRNGTAWKSNTQSLSAAYLRLLPNHSCSIRAASNNKVSVW